MKEFLFNVSVFSPQLNRLVSLQSFCDSNQVKANKNIRAFLLSESEWDGVHQLVYTLKPFDKYTKALQSERVTLSDFFGYWTMLRIKVAKVNDNLSANLLLRMNDYHEMLMENPSILGAVFLDPRYQRGLTNKQPAAIQFLVNLYLRMQVVESDTVEQEIVEVDVVDDMSEDDSLEDMNVFLNACGSVHQNNNNNIVNNNVSNNKEQFISELLTDRSTGFEEINMGNMGDQTTKRSRTVSFSNSSIFNSAYSNYCGKSIFVIAYYSQFTSHTHW